MIGGPEARQRRAAPHAIARIPLRTAAGGPFPGGSLLVAGDRVWVLGAGGAMAVDPARDRVVAEIRLGGSFTVSDAIVHDGELWISRKDGSVTRFDAHTGRRLGRAPLRNDGFLVPVAGNLLEVSRDAVAAMDPATGGTLWRRPLGTDLHDAVVSGSRVFVVGGDGPVGTRDRVWQLDARTGRIAGTLTMPEFGPESLAAVGHGVWVITAGGRAVIVEP